MWEALGELLGVAGHIVVGTRGKAVPMYRMYRNLPESDGNVLAYALEVELTEEDVEKLQAELEVAMDQRGPLRLLVKVDGLDDIEPAAVWQDLEMTPAYVQDIDRLAVVGDRRWHEWIVNVSDTFADAACFAPEDHAAAWEWVEDPRTSRADAS